MYVSRINFQGRGIRTVQSINMYIHKSLKDILRKLKAKIWCPFF